MNGKTNVQMIGLAAGLATVVIWLLGYFAPELMATAPTGLEAAITGIFAVVVGAVANEDAGIKSLPGTGAKP